MLVASSLWAVESEKENMEEQILSQQKRLEKSHHWSVIELGVADPSRGVLRGIEKPEQRANTAELIQASSDIIQ